MFGSVFVMISLGMNGFINAQGFANKGMLTVLIGAVLNIVLDPIFIFALDMGVSGAALATVISQLASALWVIRFLTGKKTLYKLDFKHMRLQAKLVWEIVSARRRRLHHELYDERRADRLQHDARAVRRRPVRRRHDRHQLDPRGDVRAGSGITNAANR